MLFYVLLFGPTLALAGGIVFMLYRKCRGDDIFFFVFLSMLVVAPMTTAPIVSWSKQSGDLAKVSTQDHIINVQLERIESLNERLESFDYPRGALLNKDSPVSSIVASLTNAEESLAIAKHERAEAYRSIEARRLGPMGGAVSFVGD